MNVIFKKLNGLLKISLHRCISGVKQIDQIFIGKLITSKSIYSTTFKDKMIKLLNFIFLFTLRYIAIKQ